MGQFPNPDGRNTIEFSDDDWKKIKNLCAMFSSGEDIAAIMDVNYDTLLLRIKDLGYSSFPDFFKKHSANGRASLRSKQYQKAVKEGNTTMLIWLGKQYLNQKDTVEFETNKPITLNYNLDKCPGDNDDDKADSSTEKT